jgi:hypothetical protein
MRHAQDCRTLPGIRREVAGVPSAAAMSKPTYRELATDFDLWCSFVCFENPVSEREFGQMSVDEKLDILRGCFGSEIRARRSRLSEERNR